MKTCHQCGTPLPGPARYCIECGAPQFQSIGSAEEGPLDLEAALAPQLTRGFFAALRRRIEEEQPGGDRNRYIQRLQDSGFIETVQRRASQLEAEIEAMVSRHGPDRARIERTVETVYDALLDFFFLHLCRDINPIPLPEAILKYGTAAPDEVDLFSVVLDYLDLEREEEDIYLSDDFLRMAPELLRNAGQNFLFPAKGERIYLLCDQSLFGTCREGFALTERALYWKAPLQRARQVRYADLDEISKQKEWITVNGHFFHVNLVLDIKMLKLLRRFRTWFA